LAPRFLADVYKDILTISRVIDSEMPGEAERRGLELVQRMQREICAIREKTQSESRPLVYCEEWGKLLILSQPWVAELVEAAGGRFFGQPGTHTTEEEVADVGPDVILAWWVVRG